MRKVTQNQGVVSPDDGKGVPANRSDHTKAS